MKSLRHKGKKFSKSTSVTAYQKMPKTRGNNKPQAKRRYTAGNYTHKNLYQNNQTTSKRGIEKINEPMEKNRRQF